MTNSSLTRRYAVVLGSLAFTATILRGLFRQAGIAATLGQALSLLVVAALLGGIVGWIAQWTLDESIRTLFVDGMKRTEPPSRSGNSQPA